MLEVAGICAVALAVALAVACTCFRGAQTLNCSHPENHSRISIWPGCGGGGVRAHAAWWCLMACRLRDTLQLISLETGALAGIA